MTDFSYQFVGQKLAKARWRPRDSNDPQQSLYFLTGSYEDPLNELALWKSGCPNIEERSLNDAKFEFISQKIASVSTQGDITDIKVDNFKWLLLLVNVHFLVFSLRAPKP